MSSSKIIELDQTNTCELCNNAFAKYSCPKCSIKYCSLPCYQAEKHLQCSEEFYKNCVAEHLSLEDNEESKKKMQEILERNQIDASFDEVDSDDEADIEELSDRLAGVDLDNADQVWDKLTEDERQEFVAFLKSGDVTKLIASWTPWWLHSSKNIEEVENAEDYKTKCPQIIDIQNFSEISKRNPSDCVKYNLINVIAAYAFTTRYFNGEYYDFVKEAVTCIIELSLLLKTSQNFEDFSTSIKSVEFQCMQSDWIQADEENFKIFRDDVNKILTGPNLAENKFYILCALSDLHKLLSLAVHKKETKSSFSKTFPNNHFPDVKLASKSKIKNSIKKIDYLLSFAKDLFSM